MEQQRTREHEVGDLGVGEVALVFKRAGYAVEGIDKDYGDDLLVQTHHEGRMDASRLWVQVKGTEKISNLRTSTKSKKNRFSYPVPFDSAMRWIRTIDLVIVVLWDIENNVGWYAVPRRQVDVWKGMTSGQKWVTLHFGKTLETEPRPPRQGEFTVEAAKRLAWESRFEHFHMLMLDAIHVAEWRKNDPSSTKGAERRKLALVMREFLNLLELSDRDQAEPGHILVKSETRQRATDLAKALKNGEPINGKVLKRPATVKDNLKLISLLLILERLSEIDSDLAIPPFLFANTAKALALPLGLAQYYEENPSESPENEAWADEALELADETQRL
jgi:hypothetical protein